MQLNNLTVTVTFGDCAEENIGAGFSKEDLVFAKDKFEQAGCLTELVCLNNALYGQAEDAFVLIVKEGVDALGCDSDDLLNEQAALDVDKKAFMYGRVVNKHARYNLCFAEESLEAHYESGQGSVVSFESVPMLCKIRENLPSLFGEKARDLFAQGNYYHDVTKCGIGFHGDTQRKKVIALRLGRDMPLHFQWWHRGERTGKRVRRILQHGDLYAMSEKATGYDWKKKDIFTLRHAAGASKFLK